MSKKKLGTNPKDLLGIKKVPLNLVPAIGIIYEADAMRDGGLKYGPYNWRKNKVIASIYIAAAMRHIMAWHDQREENALDSGVHHLGHARACLNILLDAQRTGNLIDDRPEGGKAADLMRQLERKNDHSKTIHNDSKRG